jgi:hypothetical protein
MQIQISWLVLTIWYDNHKTYVFATVKSTKLNLESDISWKHVCSRYLFFESDSMCKIEIDSPAEANLAHEHGQHKGTQQSSQIVNTNDSTWARILSGFLLINWTILFFLIIRLGKDFAPFQKKIVNTNDGKLSMILFHVTISPCLAVSIRSHTTLWPMGITAGIQWTCIP